LESYFERLTYLITQPERTDVSDSPIRARRTDDLDTQSSFQTALMRDGRPDESLDGRYILHQADLLAQLNHHPRPRAQSQARIDACPLLAQQILLLISTATRTKTHGNFDVPPIPRSERHHELSHPIPIFVRRSAAPSRQQRPDQIRRFLRHLRAQLEDTPHGGLDARVRRRRPENLRPKRYLHHVSICGIAHLVRVSTPIQRKTGTGTKLAIDSP